MTPDLPKTEMAILEMTNAFRKENALGSLKSDAKLAAAARAYAKYLAEVASSRTRGWQEAGATRRGRGLQVLLHRREPRDGCQPQRILNAGTGGRGAVGLEEVAAASRQSSAGGDHGSWRRRREGAGPSGKYVAVQMFGLPESQRLAFSIENMSGTAVEYRLSGKAHSLTPGKTITYRSCGSMALSFPSATRSSISP